MFSVTLMGSWFDSGIIQAASLLGRPDPKTFSCSSSCLKGCNHLVLETRDAALGWQIGYCIHLWCTWVCGWCCPGWEAGAPGLAQCSAGNAAADSETDLLLVSLWSQYPGVCRDVVSCLSSYLSSC